MSYLPMVMQLAGSYMSSVGSIQAGRQQAAASEANARISEAQAAQVRQSGDYEVLKAERAKKQALSRQQMLYAKSGVVISEGSPLEVQADTATQYQMDINAMKYNTEINARRYEYQASLDRMQGKQYKNASYINAGSTLLTSFGNAAIKYGGSTAKSPTVNISGYGSSGSGGIGYTTL